MSIFYVGFSPNDKGGKILQKVELFRLKVLEIVSDNQKLFPNLPNQAISPKSNSVSTTPTPHERGLNVFVQVHNTINNHDLTKLESKKM